MMNLIVSGQLAYYASVKAFKIVVDDAEKKIPCPTIPFMYCSTLRAVSQRVIHGALIY